MLLRVIVLVIAIVMLYRFLARFILPVFQITKLTSQRLRDMQQQMEDMQQKVNTGNHNAKPKNGDYIDYEEVK